MKERIGITGMNGFLGDAIDKKIHESAQYFSVPTPPEPVKLDREGNIPSFVKTIFDCAAYGNFSHQTDLREIYQANLMRVIKETEQLTEDSQYLYVSSSSVLLPKQTPYSLSKKAAEEYLQHKAIESGLRIAIMRPYSITGVGEQKEHLIPKLINSCLTGEEMPFVPRPRHDFIDVSDVADAMLTIMDKGQLKGEIYNVGSGKSYSNQEVKDMVEKVTGKKANTVEVDSLRSYDTEDWISNNERISTLGWEPTKTLEQSIIEMVNERKNN